MKKKYISIEKAIFLAFCLLLASVATQLVYIFPRCTCGRSQQATQIPEIVIQGTICAQHDVGTSGQTGNIESEEKPPPPPPPPPRPTPSPTPPRRDSNSNSAGGDVRKEAPPPRQEPRKILLFAYPRTGSSITGDIIAHSLKVSYYFEPSYFVVQRKHQTNDTVLGPLLQTVFTCNFSAAFLENLSLHNLQMYRESSALARCRRMRKGRPMDKCIQSASATCKRQKVTIKSIRLSMRLAGKLLDKNPDLVVIVLQRDPRAAIYSHKLTFQNVKNAEMRTFARTYCSTMLENLREARRLLVRHPGQIRFIRYERLADNPLGTFRNLYRYVQLNWDNGTLDNYITEHMGPPSGSSNESRPILRNKWIRVKDSYSLTRPDASAAASSWRKDIPTAFVKEINDECKEVMDLLGYRRIGGVKDVRNISVPSVGSFKYVDRLPFRGMDLSP